MGLTSIVMVRPGLLVLSRPADRLSPVTTTSFVTALGGLGARFNVAILLMRRHLRSIFPVTSGILLVRGNYILLCSSPHTINGGLGVVGPRRPVLGNLPDTMELCGLLSSSSIYPLAIGRKRRFFEHGFGEGVSFSSNSGSRCSSGASTTVRLGGI